MALRFKKSIKVAPGVKVNLGKKSVGLSVGGKYGGMSFNSKNGTRVRASAPGTGITYSSRVGKSGKRKAPARSTNAKEQKVKNPTPVIQRTWFLILSILFIVSGLLYLATDAAVGFLTMVIGTAMLIIRFVMRSKASNYQGQETDDSNSESE